MGLVFMSHIQALRVPVEQFLSADWVPTGQCLSLLIQVCKEIQMH